MPLFTIKNILQVCYCGGRSGRLESHMIDVLICHVVLATRPSQSQIIPYPVWAQGATLGPSNPGMIRFQTRFHFRFGSQPLPESAPWQNHHWQSQMQSYLKTTLRHTHIASLPLTRVQRASEEKILPSSALPPHLYLPHLSFIQSSQY